MGGKRVNAKTSERILGRNMKNKLMNIFRKKSAESGFFAFVSGNKGSDWREKSYSESARDGYLKNVVAYHCINTIAKSVASIPIILKVKGEDKEDPTKEPLLKLLMRPNATQSYSGFITNLVMYRLISGNAYIRVNQVSTRKIMDMALMRPDYVSIEVKDSIPVAYKYMIDGKIFIYPIDQETFESEVLHLKEPHPLNNLYGLSPIGSAMMAVDQHNAAGEWNKNLLENEARPTGAICVRNPGDGSPGPTQTQIDDIAKMFNEKYAGYRNAGKIPVLSFEMLWQNMGMNPGEMEWLSGKESNARDICLAFNYPAFLLGLPGGATYNNMAEAKLALYEEAVIPLAKSIMDELSYFLSTLTLQEVKIDLDLDQVSALMPRREIARANARSDFQAGLISINEARQEMGYTEVANGDDLYLPAGKLPLGFESPGSLSGELKALGYDDLVIKKLLMLDAS